VDQITEQDRKRFREQWRTDGLRALTGIAPIFKLSWSGVPRLVGTGFWATETGLLVTAWHVITDNFDSDGKDVGPLMAIQTTDDLRVIPRGIRRTYNHDTFDLALSQTEQLEPHEGRAVPTKPMVMTLDEPVIGTPVFTHAFASPSQAFTNERYEGISAGTFNGILETPELSVRNELSFVGRIGFGNVTNIFQEARDKVMMPFPCFQSDIPIYGANSGGPVFDNRGRICGVNCTSFEGTDISFHIPLRGILDLRATGISFIPEDPFPRKRTIAELGLAKRVPFQPELIDVFYTPWAARLMRPYIWVRYWMDWVRWKASASLRDRARRQSEEYHREGGVATQRKTEL
jgi:hypothetical protein